VYIVYCGKNVSCGNYLHIAAESAKLFRSYSKSLQIALITSYKGDTLEGKSTYNTLVPIPDDIIFPGTQWLTRLFALKLSPFEITLEIDSDTVACGDIQPILESIYLHKFGKFDFSVMSNNAPNSDFFPQNGVLLYNTSSSCFHSIWKTWMKRQNHFENTTGIRDDQYTLGTVIKDRIINGKYGDRCKVFRLSSSFNAVLSWRYPALNGKKDWWDNPYWSSGLISSKVYIVHANGAFMFAKQICDLVNEKADKPRILTYKNEGPPKYPTWDLRFSSYNVSYSLKDCYDQLDGHCNPDVTFVENILLPLF